MAQSKRQSELFAGQDWTVIYKAFSEVNLNAFDFDTIRQSMKDYIQRNYPEDFNDWIESSEFVAILDLLAYLGQSLAFRMDINARENFMEVARARESILRLARFLSYSPKRNQAAKGLVKLTEIKANQDIYDSAGNNLNNIVIQWDDPNNPNWFEQFILVMNAALIPTNPFGTPLKISNLDGVATQLYRLENIPFTSGNLPFTATVNSATYNFDICNVDFNNKQAFFERTPDPQASFHLMYRNDGNGNSSKDTGFFLMFKQGSLLRSDLSVNEPIENRIIDIDFQNINESDIWVQSVLDNGNIDREWSRVGYVPNDDLNKIYLSGENISYNSESNNVRDIFQVITRDNDRISIRFGDGRFGTIPMGNLRVWHRQSANANLLIRPEDMRNIAVTLPYQNRLGKQSILSLSFSLQESVINGTISETNEEIRRRTGAVYSTQGRMVSGDDYNTLPASNSIALKIKAINRVYSGHSRFIDLNDPTGTYQNANVFSDDGCIFRENQFGYSELPLTNNFSTEDMIQNYVLPYIKSVEMRDFLYQIWLEKAGSLKYEFIFSGEAVRWQQSTNSIYSSTGRFVRSDTIPMTSDEWDAAAIVIGNYAPDLNTEKFILPTSMLKMRQAGWITVESVESSGVDFLTNGRGPVRVNEKVTSGDEVLQVIPAFRKSFTVQEYNTLKQFIENKRSFGLGWDHIDQEWYFIDSTRLVLGDEYDFITKGQTDDSSWLIKFEYSTLNWRITSRGIKYVFESERDVKFYFASGVKAIDPNTGQVGIDSVNVLSTNLNPLTMTARDWFANTRYYVGDIIRREEIANGVNITNYYECVLNHTSSEEFVPYAVSVDTSVAPPKGILIEQWRVASAGLSRDVKWTVEEVYNYDDGYQEPRRVRISFFDSDLDGQPDNPESFGEVVNSGNWIFHERTVDNYGTTRYKLTSDVIAVRMGEELPVLKPGQVVFLHDSENINGIFYRNLLPISGVPVIGRTREIALLADQTEYSAAKGRNDLKFHWKHYAPIDHRMDPAINNIIDVFVLSREYHSMMNNWYDAGANMNLLPSPPSELMLRSSFSELEQFKMFSDQISWRPVKYKLLFGNSAAPELKAKFKIVRLPNTSVSDGEIKSRIIEAIQTFFDVNNWDFGETFYYTELAGYLHRQLVNAISSVVIVPLKDSQAFGDLFEVRCNPDEMFFPTASVNDIEIIPANTSTSLRIK